MRAEMESRGSLEKTAETRALESAVLWQEDIRTLLPRPIELARRNGPAVPDLHESAGGKSAFRGRDSDQQLALAKATAR